MHPHSSTQELEEYIRGNLSVADSSVVQTHLDECEDCQLRLAGIAIQTQWKGPERRTEPRIPVRFHGRLKLLDTVTSVDPPHDVEVIEISRSGMKISTPGSLVPKTLVQVRFNGKTVLAEVRWCIRTESDYHAGLKLVKDFTSM